ncbi:MAG: glycosyltransferase [Bacteroidales bacterium]|nr:glycosyltransferase [Bacteroidales bacterium]
MNILYINSFDCSPDASGGVNRLVYILSEKLSADYGYHCFLGYFEDTTWPPATVFDGRIKLSSPFDDKKFESFLLKNSITIVQINFIIKRYFHSIENIYQIASRNNIKVIYGFHMNPGYQIQAYYSWDKVKYCFTRRQQPFKELSKFLFMKVRLVFSPFIKMMLKPKYRIPYDNCDVVVVSAKEYVRDYIDIASEKDNSKFVVIGNMLSYDFYISHEECINKDKEVVVVARFDDSIKRVSLVLKIWKLIEDNPGLTDWKLTILGNGIDRDFYMYLCNKLNLKRVSFVGEQPPLKYYKRSSILMMTSGAEGWPMVLMGALPMGVTTIVFDSFGALHDIFLNCADSHLIPNNNINLFYKKMSEVMLDDNYRLELCTNAIEISKRFESTVIVNKWHDLYKSLMT